MMPLLLPLLLLAGAQQPPDDVTEVPPPPMQTVQSLDAMEQARQAAARGDMAEALSRYLRVLSAKPDEVPALIGAGQAALAVGDLNAANGFFAHADSLSPNNGAVKAGLGSILVQQGNARDALRYFRAAAQANYPEEKIAADRGLAYDLRGETRRAQAEYALALRARPGDPMTLRRLALSQAIGGEQATALATLDPLLRRQDVPAWRTRMFVRALTGDVAGAEADAPLLLPPAQVAALTPYLARLVTLKPAEKAEAVFLGRFPRPTILAAATPRPASPIAKPQPTPPPVTVAAAPPPIAAPAPARVAQAAPPPAIAPVPEAVASIAVPSPIVTAAPPPAKVAPALAAIAPARAEPAPAPAPPPHVDTGTIAPTAAERRAAQAEARAEAQREAREKQAAAAKLAAAKAAAEEKAAAKKNPERHWVQVAGGANRADLPKAWRQLKARHAGALAGRSPFTMHYRYTNRLMIGPFPSSDAAQDWVNEHRKQGFSTFSVTTAAGVPVEPVDE